MNDLSDLRDAWGQPDPPSQTAYSAARADLMRQIGADGSPVAAPKPRHRRGVRLAWLTGATALTAAVAAVTVFAFTPDTTRTGQQAGQASGELPSQLSGQQILLAAATVAEAKPAATGTYWHLKVSFPDHLSTGDTLIDNTWTTHDGTTYAMLQDGIGVVLTGDGQGFQVGGSHLTYEQIKQLPTDPAALKAWITDSFTHPPAGQPVPEIPAAAIPETVAGGLSVLLWQAPAPPAVRAAAFRALASMPNVTNLGTMDGGQALRVSFASSAADKLPGGKLPAGAEDGLRLVINPTTSMLLSQTNFQGTVKILTAEWTNQMPKVVQPPMPQPVPSPNR
jgi:hypothetical protein